MMGIKGRAFGPLPPVTLEELVPPNNFYRHLEDTLDLRFVRDLVRDAYAPSGRPSIDPVVFFKLHLVLFFEGLRSERQLMQVVTDRLSLRWYLGYDLNEPLPDHSSLSRIRERYGLDVFRRFFDRIVEQCIAAGLVWGQEFYLDATRVQANAALDSLQPRFAVAAHLARLFAADGDEIGNDGASDGPDAPDAADAPARLPVTLTEESRAALVECAADRQDWIGRAGRPDRTTRSGPYRRTADFRVSTTDPDATPMPYGDKGTRLGYQDHYVVDGGRARIILTALVTPAEVQENQPALDLLWHALPLEGAAPPSDGGHQIRDDREHRRYRAGTHPRLRPTVRRWPAGWDVRHYRLRLRRGGRYLPLSGTPKAALHLAVRDDPAADLRSPKRSLRRLHAPAPVHDVEARPARGA